MTKRRIHNHLNCCLTEFLPPLTWLSHKIISQVKNTLTLHVPGQFCECFQKAIKQHVSNKSLVYCSRTWCHAIYYSNPASFGSSICSWLQLSPSDSTNLKRQVKNINTAEWLPVPVERKLLSTINATITKLTLHRVFSSFTFLSFPAVFCFFPSSSQNLAPYFSIFKIKICQSSRDEKVGKSLYKWGWCK